MKKMKALALLLCGALAVSMFAGCSKEIDKTATVATANETEVSLGLANFAARLQQAQYDDFYVAYMGEDVWRSDLYGYGVTMQESLKSGIMDSLYELYTLKANMAEYGVEITDADKAAIAEAAAEFISDNSQEALDALGADQEIVEEYLTLLTIQTRMQNAIIADADTNVSDEEANTSAYSYVYISKSNKTDAEGNSVDLTDDEKAALGDKAAAMLELAKKDSLENAAEAENYSVSKGTYHKDDSLTDELKACLTGLKEGEIELVETDAAYYIVRMDALTDAEATQTKRESIIAERQSDLYASVVEGYQETIEWKVKDNVWKQVQFDNLFTTVLPSTEGTEAVGTEQ